MTIKSFIYLQAAKTEGESRDKQQLQTVSYAILLQSASGQLPPGGSHIILRNKDYLLRLWKLQYF